ncbi:MULTISPECIES: hypothetical protein [unclassified Chromohalobacter]|nr:MULTISPECIES: hypothetical protein [unclassified Chromohalobacter]
MAALVTKVGTKEGVANDIDEKAIVARLALGCIRDAEDAVDALMTHQ